MAEKKETGPEGAGSKDEFQKKNLLERSKSVLGGLFSTVDQIHRDNAVALTAYEARELENMFVLLLMGAFTGLPSPPSFISVELLPHLQHEIEVLNRRAESAGDALAELAGMMDVT